MYLINVSVKYASPVDDFGLLRAPSMLLVFVAFALASINRENTRFEQ